MFNSRNYQSTSADSPTSNSAKPIATGVIIHDSNRDRATWAHRLWQYLMHHLLRGHEPRVWQKRNAAGEVYHCGYDPYSGRTTYLTSDTDLRAWLDQLPYC
jgi:hypothetical protein